MGEALSAFIGKLSNEVNRGVIIINVFCKEVLIDKQNSPTDEESNEGKKDDDINCHQSVFYSEIYTMSSIILLHSGPVGVIEFRCLRDKVMAVKRPIK